MTLIELAVVVAIIGVIAMIAMPRFYNMVSTLRARGAADQLATDIAYTRLNAVRNGRTASLTVNGTQYTIAVENEDGTTFKSLRTVDLASTYSGTTVTVTGGNGRIAFDSRGMLRANSASEFAVIRGDRRQRLTVNAIGKVFREKTQ